MLRRLKRKYLKQLFTAVEFKFLLYKVKGFDLSTKYLAKLKLVSIPLNRFYELLFHDTQFDSLEQLDTFEKRKEIFNSF